MTAPAHYWQPSDVDKIIAAAPPGPARLFALFLWRTGARRAEALAAKWKDLDFEANPPELRIPKGKGGKWRLVPVHPELAQALAYHPDRGKHDARLFPLSPRTANRIIEAAIIDAGLVPKADRAYRPGPHSLRHSAIRHWLASGVPLNQVSLWAGHSQITTTMKTYLPLVPDHAGNMERVA